MLDLDSIDNKYVQLFSNWFSMIFCHVAQELKHFWISSIVVNVNAIAEINIHALNYVINRAQAPVWHWPKCWGLRNVNNRQKCTKNFFFVKYSINIFLSNSGRLIKKQKLFVFSTILNKLFFQNQVLKGFAKNQV